MTWHPNSDGRANLLKSQGENGPNPLIENQPREPEIGDRYRLPDGTIWVVMDTRSTPRGGGRAEEGLPPSQRPFSLSGQRRSEK